MDETGARDASSQTLHYKCKVVTKQMNVRVRSGQDDTVAWDWCVECRVTAEVEGEEGALDS